MESTKANASSPGFPREAINLQLKKILSDPHFLHSDILSRFLEFIVKETIEGGANRLKEYTIALNVLRKPKTFDPKENCIVRIHAVRLRKALQDYYNGPGAMDEIRIILPKGNYVPIFNQNIDHVLNSVLNPQPPRQVDISMADQTWTTAVLPFHFQDGKQMVKDFTDGLAVQLSSELTKIKSLSVVSYSISRRLPEKFTSVKEVGQLFHTQYVFTGDVQFRKNLVRVTIEMIKTETSEQVWSERFERELTRTNSFTIQDEIIEKVIKTVYRQARTITTRNSGMAVMAVA